MFHQLIPGPLLSVHVPGWHPHQSTLMIISFHATEWLMIHLLSPLLLWLFFFFAFSAFHFVLNPLNGFFKFFYRTAEAHPDIFFAGSSEYSTGSNKYIAVV